MRLGALQGQAIYEEGRLVVKKTEAAYLLSVSRRTIDTMIAKGQLKAVRVCGQRRVTMESIRMLVEGLPE